METASIDQKIDVYEGYAYQLELSSEDVSGYVFQ